MSLPVKSISDGAEPGGSFEPRTLYHDTDGDGALSSGDSAVRYNFSVSSMSGEYTDFADNSNGQYTGFWPYDSVTLIQESEINTGSCRLNSPEDCTQYDWTFGAYSWFNSILVYTGDSLYDIDDPIRFTQIHVMHLQMIVTRHQQMYRL